jgi:glycosyltransferase involved in cell wall biosynthesis
LKELPSVYRGTARIALFPFYNKLKTILQASSGITAISEMYIKWAKEYCVDKKPTAFFYPAIEYDEVQEAFERFRLTIKKDESKLRIIYAGSLASSYDIPTILQAADIVEDQFPGKVQFIIAGTGPQEALIKAKNRKNVTFLGWLGQEEIYKEFFLSHIGLIQHIKGATQSVTYKLFDYLGAGLPILNSLPSEMWDIIEKNHVGFNNKSGDADLLAANIEKFIIDKNLLQLYKQNALNLTSQQGNSKVVYKKLIHFIESVT